MEQVKIDNQTLFHPSFFQTPVGRIQQDPKKWLKNINGRGTNESGSNQSVERFTQRDVQMLKDILQPQLERPDNNTIPTLLYYTFFSIKNIQHVQELIRKTVYKWSNHLVGTQSETTLIQLMDEIYEKFAQNIDEYSTPKQHVKIHISNQMLILNSHVVDQAVPIIINNVEQHLKYLEQIDSKVRVIDNPTFDSITGTKMYRSFDQLF